MSRVVRCCLPLLTTTLLALAALAALGAPAASADTQTVGLTGWQVQSSAQAPQSGEQISTSGFATGSWLRVRPDDAGAVGTEVNALVQTGHCPDVFFSTNMKDCFGYMDNIGPDTIQEFSVPWWFRTNFVTDTGSSRYTDLIINGVVGQADVWVNGHEVATQDTVQGAFTRYTFDITSLLHRGLNTLALEVYPNDPTAMFTLDNVDWTQIPPDNNTGIQFPIELHTSGGLALSNSHVVQNDATDLSSAALTVKADVTNHAGTSQTGRVSATVQSPSGPAIRVSRSVTVAAGATQTVSFTPDDDPELLVHHPSVWWPIGMGQHPLYSLRTSLTQAGAAADTESETFGIRTVSTRLIGATPGGSAPNGSRQFLVNGVPFVFRGGGWSEDLFLRYSAADTANQIEMIKNLGLNGIRTEGKQMPDDFYEQFDRAGILIDGGFQCCDAWQLQDSGLNSPHDFDVLANSALTIGQNLRNHPSVLNFSWSDNNPTRQQEVVSLQAFQQADFQDPLIASAEYKTDRLGVLGPSGEKEGPYDWVPPSYWYDTTHFDPGDSSRTNVGGAWAFDSEASAGHTVPTLDSIQRFMSPFEQTELWQNPDYNQYHANYEPDLPDPDTNGGYSFGTLHDLDKAITARYGAWSGLDQYVEEAQVQNYETQRAQFEAYIDHSTNAQAPSTGVVYWQLNKGWPTLLWDLYNHDYDQAGSYFGAKKANEPLHVLYAYDTGMVSVDNLSGWTQRGLSVESKVYSVGGTLLDDQTASGISLTSQGVAQDVLHPAAPATGSAPQTYFVELLLTRHGQLVDRNVYWLSTQPDEVNWDATMGNPQATMTQYGDLKQLQSLDGATVRVTARTHQAWATDGGDTETDVTITNTSNKPTVAFFLRADVRRGSRSGAPAPGDNEILPIMWSDNDVTLWPGESETLRARYRHSDLAGASPVVSVSGWNAGSVDVPAGW
ncbi:MAG: glycosyl hydrolase 2 galactose-binding domain-containing protein [Solirubrobacteraceae bacterium]